MNGKGRYTDMEERIDYVFSYKSNTEEESEINKKWRKLIDELSNDSSIQVSYDGYDGQLIGVERKEFGPCMSGEMRVVYGITLRNQIQHVTCHITGLKVENVKFLGTSIFK